MAPPKKKPRRADERDEDVPRKSSKDRKAKTGGGMGLWIALGAIGLVLIICIVAGGGIGAYFIFRGKPGNEAVTATPEGLRDQFSALMQAVEANDNARSRELAKEFIIPNHRDWLKKTFGDVDGAKAIADYEQTVINKDIASGFVNEMKDRLRKNETEIRADALDPNDRGKATGTQLGMLDKMKTPTQLHSVRFTVPGKALGYRMDSFVYVDGKFRMLGRLRSLSK